MTSTPNTIPRVYPSHSGASKALGHGADYGYPWMVPPASFESFDYANSIVLPAIATPTAIISFQVRSGLNGIIRAYANKFVGAGYTDGSGEIYWQILHAGGQTPVRFYNKIVSQLGDVINPTYHPSGIRIFENEVIVLSVTNVSIAPAGQQVAGRLAGWFYPKKYDDPYQRV